MSTLMPWQGLARSRCSRPSVDAQSKSPTPHTFHSRCHRWPSSLFCQSSTVCLASAVQQEFSDLAAACGAHLECVEAKPHNNQRGLFATRAVEKDEALLYVPLAACLSYENDAGLTLPNAPWPRLAAAVQAAGDTEFPPPWDMLLAHALVDVSEGGGDSFSTAYADAFLPQPRALTLPFCQSEAALEELQHPQVAAAALERRQLLERDFPDVNTAFLDGTETTPLQWGLACIRSRAFQLSNSLFAAVPFADVANHAARPNARLAPTLDAPDAIRTGTADNWVALVATEDIPAGAEVTVSYTGSAGATNRRLLVQYGFVLPGNESDRFDFELFEGYVGTTPLRGAPGASLSLSRIQNALGDEAFHSVMSGGDQPLLCALKSIPTYSMEAAEMPNAAQVLKDEAAVVEKLQRKLDSLCEEFTTTLEDDLELQDAGGLSRWRATAVAYRVERKQLARASQRVLDLYRRIIEEGT
eukprot:jgi/Ulvmu1/6081/UM027_0059.1